MRRPYGVVRGQKVSDAKAARAKELRGTPTPQEELLWHRLRRNQLGVHFRRQQLISGFIVDFYCHRAALVVEIDGPIHDSQRSADEARDNIIASRGLCIVRIAAESVDRDIGAVVAQIRAAAQLGVTQGR